MADILPVTTHPNNFLLVFDRVPAVNYFCRRVTIPGIELPPAMQTTSAIDIPQPGEKAEFGDFIIEFALDINWDGYLEISKWMRGLARIGCNSYGDMKDLGVTSMASVILTSNHKNPKRIMRIHDCWPSSLGAVTMDTEIQDSTDMKVIAAFKCTYTSFEDEMEAYKAAEKIRPFT